MLTLSRKAGQTIVVDGPAVFLIDQICGNRVFVRVSAPLTTRILRGELLDDAGQLKEAKKDAGV